MKTNFHLSKREIKILNEMLLDEKKQIIHSMQKNESKDGVEESIEEIRKKIRQSNRESLYLKKIENSLKKIKSGEYGMCDECESPILFSQLKARPTSNFCIVCKEDSEKEEQRDHFNSRKVSNDLQPVGHFPNKFELFGRLSTIEDDVKTSISTIGNLIKWFWKRLKFW